MKYTVKTLTALLFPFVLNAQTPDGRILLIGIDGVRADALIAAETPHMDALMENAVYSTDALNDDVTSSGPGWSGVLCGVRSDKHLVASNDFSGNNYAEFPPFLHRVEDWNSALQTFSICHWAPINDDIIDGGADFILNTTSDGAVRDAAVSALESNDPDVMFLHFDDVDYAGHAYGYSPNISSYTQAIETADALVGDVMESLTNRPNYANENWLVLVTTDHGGLGFSHGGSSIEEQNVFFIASGLNISPQEVVKDTLEVTPPPVNCLGGDGTELVFAGDGSHVSIPESMDFQMGAEQDFTIEVRIRTAVTPDVAIVGNKDWNSGNYPGFVFSFEYPSGPAWKVNIGDGSNRADANGSAGLNDGQWHTLSCSFDRDGMMRLYTDGVFDSEEYIGDVGDIDVGEGLRFGADIYDAYAYSGSIGEVRFWHGILSDSEIADWHCNSVDSVHPRWSSLAGYWKLDEGDGAVAVEDASDNEHTGSISGATWQIAQPFIIYDYSNTPRLIDVAVTAMTHMCMEIEDSWELDGISWVPGCNPSDIAGEVTSKSARIYPNPGAESFRIVCSDVPESVQVFDATGKTVLFLSQCSNDMSLSTQAWPSGIYFIRIQQSSGTERLQWVKRS